MKDGKDHINIYSQGKTKLGRWLSNFHKSIIVTEHGKFASVEGYWYWLGTRDEDLRYLYGYKAKECGRGLKKIVNLSENEFKWYIQVAIIDKILRHDYIKQEFKESVLPFDHYYTYGDKVVRPEQYQWITEHITAFREVCKALDL